VCFCPNWDKKEHWDKKQQKIGTKKYSFFDRENQIIPWQGVYFFTNTVLQKSQQHTVVMKNMINTIGKKIHTLVKEKHTMPS